jgi:hypothetical protein
MAITMQREDFIATFGAVSLACSDDFTRPHLNSVRVAVENGKLIVQATDGCWAAQRITDAPEGSFPCETLIPVSAVKEALRAAKGAKQTRTVMLDGAFIIGPVTLGYTAVVASFPPFEQVFPKPRAEKTGSEFAVADNYLAIAAKAFGLFGSKKPVGIRIELGEGELDPLTLSSPSAPGFTVVVMPFRCERAAHRNATEEKTSKAA